MDCKKTLLRLIAIVAILMIVACATQEPQFRPNSPEDHTKSFIKALFENPFK